MESISLYNRAITPNILKLIIDKVILFIISCISPIPSRWDPLQVSLSVKQENLEKFTPKNIDPSLWKTFPIM